MNSRWVARLRCRWLSLEKATRITHGEKKSPWDNTVLKKKPAVGKAYVTLSDTPTPGLKERTFDSPGILPGSS